jgi:hypothetical protein
MALSRIIKRHGIPEPAPDLGALYATVMSMKEIVEELTRQRGENIVSAVTVQDMIDLGIVESRPGGRAIRAPAREPDKPLLSPARKS